MWGAGGVLLFDRLAHDHDLRLTAQTAAVRAWLDAIRRDLSREASLLARDRAVTEGTSGGDWSRIAQDATPRLRSLTLDGFADFVAIFDAEGMRLAQAPPSSPLTPADLASLRAAAGTEPTVRLAAVSEHLWALAAAPVEPTEGRVGPAGLVVVGRRLERQGPGGHATQLAWSGTSPALSARLSGEPDVPADLGADGRVMVDGRAWRARRLDTDPQGELWALVPAAPLDAERRRLWELWLGSLALALAAPIAVAWVVGRGRAASGLDLPEARKLGALYAGAMGGAGVDLVADAEQILDTARSFAQLEEGMVYRIQPTGGTLVATAARGLAAVPLEPLQVRPLGGSHAGEAVRTGRPVVTLGTTGRRLEPDLEAHAVGAGHRMTVSLPIRVGGTAWGALTLMGRRERPLELAELSLLETMADQVGLAASRATLFAEAQETGRRLETLTRLAQNLTATLSMEGVLQRLVDAAVELFGSSISRLWLLDDSGATLSLRASAGTRSSVQGITELKVGEGLIGKVVASRQPVVVADARTDPRIRNTERIRAEGSVSIAVVALHLGDRVLGGLSIAMREAHAYTAEELRLLQSLADQAAIAIDNARLFAAEQTRRAEMASLLEINQKIGALDPAQPEPLLQAVAEEAARLLDVDNAGIRLVEGDDLVLAGCAGTARQTMLRKRIKIGESFSGKVVERGESMIVGVGTIADMVPEHGDAEARLGYTTSLGVPLRMADRTIGVLAFRGRRAFTRRDQEVAEAFAGQAAIALEHSRLYREAARHAERMVALADLGRLVSETLDPAVVSRRVTDSLCTILGAGHATLYRVEASSGDFVVESTAGAEPPFQWAPRLPPGDGLVGVVMRDRRAAATADSLADDRVTYRPEFRRALADVTHRALLVAPPPREERDAGRSRRRPDGQGAAAARSRRRRARRSPRTAPPSRSRTPSSPRLRAPPRSGGWPGCRRCRRSWNRSGWAARRWR